MEFPILLERYHNIAQKCILVDGAQISGFSSSYFEGKNAKFAEHGYSRDHRPDKKQVRWGISTGINGISTALKIHRENVQNKTHMKGILRVCAKILDRESRLLFDCGANTPHKNNCNNGIYYNY